MNEEKQIEEIRKLSAEPIIKGGIVEVRDSIHGSGKFRLYPIDEPVFTLVEMADLIEKIWESDDKEMDKFWREEDGIDFIRLFRERPDLVEKIRKSD